MATTIDWGKSPKNWTAANLKAALKAPTPEFEEIMSFADSWLVKHTTKYDLSTSQAQKDAKAFANEVLRPQFESYFNNVPEGTVWHDEAPYGIIRFAVDRGRSKVKKSSVKTEEPDAGGDEESAPAMSRQSSRQSGHTNKPMQLGGAANPLLPTIGTQTQITFLSMINGNADSNEIEYISIDELARGAPDSAFERPTTILRYLSIEYLRTFLEQRGFNRDSSIHNLTSPNRLRAIESDMDLRESVRWCMNMGNTRFGFFDGCSPLILSPPVSSSLTKWTRVGQCHHGDVGCSQSFGPIGNAINADAQKGLDKSK